jgi:hypothetical protein
MAEQLPMGQIAPAARPVDSFIQPLRRSVTAPAQPQMMPNPQGIRLIPQASGGSVQGVNQMQELAVALAPVSKGLMSLAKYGVEMYASTEYEKGRSEAARAAVLANQQMLQSAGEYADENRRLANKDPIAGLMMDRVNPFREAGRLNQLSRIAAGKVGSEILQEYRRTPGVEELPPDSPEIERIKARAVQRITQRYGLSETTPGFIDYVLPEIAQAGDKLTEKHYDNHVKYQKETAWRQAAVDAAAAYEKARTSGMVEWTEFDPVSGTPIRRSARLDSDRAGWERGLQVLVAQIGDDLRRNSGIPGEASAFKREMFVRLSQMAQASGNQEFARILQSVAAGPVDKTGRRALAGELYGIEMLEEGNKIGQAMWQQRQRQDEQGMQAFQNELAGITYDQPDGPEKKAAIDQLVEKYSQLGIPRIKLFEAAASASRTLSDVAGRGYDPSQMDEFLQSVDAQEGSAWNASRNDDAFESLLTTVDPAQRGQYRQRYAETRRRKEKEQADVPTQLVEPLITGAIKSRLRQMYPNDVTEAALRGADITALLAWGDADIARSAQLQRSAYFGHVAARLREAAAKKGAKLDPQEITSVTSRALEEYGKSDVKNFNRLFPGSPETNEPSVGTRAKPPTPNTPAKPTPSRPQSADPVYPSSQLDNMPNRQQRLRGGSAVLGLPSVQEEITRVLNGQQPSAAVRRAARDAGFGNDVGRWLEREAGAYPEFKIPPAARNQLLRSSRDAAGVADATRQVAMLDARPVQTVAGWFFNAITGTAPAMAANFNPAQGGGRNGRGPFMRNTTATIGPVNVNRLRQAIVGKESGGSFSVVNPDSGALGYGQVMPYNVGPWTQKHYGRRLTPEQFLASRDAQLAVVNGQIGEIVQQQLAAGYKGDIAIRRAAAIWYSGRGDLYDDNRPQFTKGRRYPSIREYTLDILRRYRGS